MDMGKASAFFVILMLMGYAASLYADETVDWQARSGHGMVAFDGEMVMMGGLNAFGKALFFSDVWTSRNGAAWTRLPVEMPHPPRRHLHALLVHREHLWVFGGQGGAFLNDVWRSADGVEWEEVVSEAPWSPRRAMAGIVHDGRMYCMGGENVTGENYNDVWVSEDGEDWEKLAGGVRWQPRSEHVAVSFRNALYVLGGRSEYGQHRDVWRSEDGVSWEKIGDMPAAIRGHRAEVFRNRIIVFGGVDGQGNARAQCWASSDGIAWEVLTATAAWSPRVRHASVVYNNRLWLSGGGVAAGEVNDVWHSRDGSTWQPAPGGGLFGCASGCDIGCGTKSGKSWELLLGDVLLIGVSLLVLLRFRH